VPSGEKSIAWGAPSSGLSVTSVSAFPPRTIAIASMPASSRRSVASVAPSVPCAHNTGTGLDGSLPVQLMPYNDTPNNGGEYKAWVTPVDNFLTNCAALGIANGLAVVNCGSTAGNQHGFIGADSKTDNFKVKSKETVEIDTTFKNSQTGQAIDGLGVTWSDTHGASNKKWSYYDPAHFVNHQAHVEAPEVGTHHINVSDQNGCTIAAVSVNGSYHGTSGPQNLVVTIKPGSKNTYIQIFCA